MLSINNDRRARIEVLFVFARQISCGAVLDYCLVMLVVPYLGRIVSVIGSAVCVIVGLFVCCCCCCCCCFVVVVVLLGFYSSGTNLSSFFFMLYVHRYHKAY